MPHARYPLPPPPLMDTVLYHEADNKENKLLNLKGHRQRDHIRHAQGQWTRPPRYTVGRSKRVEI